MGALGWEGGWLSKLGLGPGKGSSSKRKASGRGGGEGGAEEACQRAATGFPVRQAVTAGSLALAGDTIAQLRERWVDHKEVEKMKIQRDAIAPNKPRMERTRLCNHDWVRALRMASYGFLLYGPGSQAWYELLEKLLPHKSARELSLKVLLNQVVLGPCVILVVFAWNSMWQGRLRELPAQYHNKAIPTLVDGWKFWIPASTLNFSLVPLDARVAFMSCCSIFWNFYLSTAMRK